MFDNALVDIVTTDHCPWTIGGLKQILAKTPHSGAAGSRTTTIPQPAVSLLTMHCHFAYAKLIPGISLALRGQLKSKNTAHFRGYP